MKSNRNHRGRAKGRRPEFEGPMTGPSSDPSRIRRMRSMTLALAMAGLAFVPICTPSRGDSPQSNEPPVGASPPLLPGPEVIGAQRRRVLDELASTRAGATSLVAAFNEARLSRNELDNLLVEKLQIIQGDDSGLARLLDSLSPPLRRVMRLDGGDGSYVDAGITLEGPFTLETWIKPDPDSDVGGSLLGAPGSFHVDFHESRLRVRTGGDSTDAIATATSLIPGAWTHLAVTRNSSGQIRLYLNGAPDGDEGASGAGRHENLDVGRGLAATLAEFRVWDACLSRFTILAQFDRTGLTPSPAFYRPLDSPWEPLRGGARMVRTWNFPPLVGPDATRALDEKFAQYRALARRPGGDSERGRTLAALCTACHRIHGEGASIGPDLSKVGATGREFLLRSILTPNAAIAPEYRLFRVELAGGTTREGFLVQDEDDTVILRVPGVEDERIPPDQLRKGEFVHRSLMPEGLEANFTPDQWADLMAYLMSLK
jgi:putative heme-binding domain-containing protein